MTFLTSSDLGVQIVYWILHQIPNSVPILKETQRLPGFTHSCNLRQRQASTGKSPSIES